METVKFNYNNQVIEVPKNEIVFYNNYGIVDYRYKDKIDGFSDVRYLIGLVDMNYEFVINPTDDIIDIYVYPEDNVLIKSKGKKNQEYIISWTHYKIINGKPVAKMSTTSQIKKISSNSINIDNNIYNIIQGKYTFAGFDNIYNFIFNETFNKYVCKGIVNIKVNIPGQSEPVINTLATKVDEDGKIITPVICYNTGEVYTGIVDSEDLLELKEALKNEIENTIKKEQDVLSRIKKN